MPNIPNRPSRELFYTQMDHNMKHIAQIVAVIVALALPGIVGSQQLTPRNASMDKLDIDGSHAVFHWTLKGTNTGPGGTGKTVRFSGYEEWTINSDGLIQQSLGHFDEAEYQRQLKNGVPPGQ